MKQLLACCLLASGAAYAQTPITISVAQYPATAATVTRYQLAATTGVAVPTKGANQSWDYRGLAPQGSVLVGTYASAGATPPFTGSNRSYALTLAPFGVTSTAYEGFDAMGYTQLGAAVPAQSFPLTAVTGGPSDALSIPAQNIAVNLLRVPLPLTSTTLVTRTSRVVSNSLLTVLLLGLNQAAFRYVQRVATVDSVAGWGTVRIPVAGSPAGSAPIPVLLVQRRTMQQDSFYLNNQPAPVFLLATLGQTQGGLTYGYTHTFYRQNSAQDVLSFSYANSTFTTLTAPGTRPKLLFPWLPAPPVRWLRAASRHGLTPPPPAKPCVLRWLPWPLPNLCASLCAMRWAG